jgi:hypothetical protein
LLNIFFLKYWEDGGKLIELGKIADIILCGNGERIGKKYRWHDTIVTFLNDHHKLKEQNKLMNLDQKSKVLEKLNNEKNRFAEMLVSLDIKNKHIQQLHDIMKSRQAFLNNINIKSEFGLAKLDFSHKIIHKSLGWRLDQLWKSVVAKTGFDEISTIHKE